MKNSWAPLCALRAFALLVGLLPVCPALLRSRPAAGATAIASPAPQASAAEVAAQLLGASPLGKGLAKKLAAAEQPAKHAAAAPAQTHKKVDVGFSDFEHNLTAQVDTVVKQITASKRWTTEMRTQLAQNMTGTLKESLSSSLKPLKQTIGKTWMALPQDAQKDEYVTQLRVSFLPVFAEALQSAGSRLSTSLQQIQKLSKETSQLASTDLLQKSEHDLEDRLLIEHCYTMDDKKPDKTFCMKSVLSAMTHRLNDTLGLISMTMRFDAGAMSLTQKSKGGSLLQNATSSGRASECSQAGDCKGVWDGQAVFGNDGQHVCDWKPMKAGWYLQGGAAPEVCLRSYNDFVSSQFREQGHFHSCLDIAAAWPNLPDGSKSGQFVDRLTCGTQCQAENGTKPGIYVDVGANIGTCVMQMLARPDVAQVVAFEPSPANLFYMTNSVTKRIQGGDPRIMPNLMLYPKALGSERSMHTLFAQPGNAGNTGVDTTVMGEKMDGVSVETITLDEVFMSGVHPPYIHLMKLDAQGYEVKILKGAPKLLASGAVNAIHIEVAPWWLIGQKTSSLEYLSMLHVNMYDLRPAQSNYFLSATELAQTACNIDKNGTMLDMLALRNRVQGAPPRAPLQCP